MVYYVRVMILRKYIKDTVTTIITIVGFIDSILTIIIFTGIPDIMNILHKVYEILCEWYCLMPFIFYCFKCRNLLFDESRTFIYA